MRSPQEPSGPGPWALAQMGPGPIWALGPYKVSENAYKVSGNAYKVSGNAYKVSGNAYKVSGNAYNF